MPTLPSSITSFLLAAVLTTSGNSQHQYATAAITTVAGNGTAGYVPGQDGGPATRAQLDEPWGTAVDAAGNLYIADRANHRIRRVDAATGIITTVAGNGIAGYAAAQDGGPAANAQLNGPRAVALDGFGNVYIADTQNHRIRRIDAGTGVLTTVAGTGKAGYAATQEGGVATAAQLDSPHGLAVDTTGNLYIADYNNDRIRKLDVRTCILTTVAGTGSAGYIPSQDGGPATAAELNHPNGIAVDQAGNLYIADTDNHRVRKVDVLSNRITTIAGNGTAGYSPLDENAPANRAALNAPSGIAVDSSGNVYLADLDNSRIRKVAAGTNTITTIAGNGISGYIASQDGGVAASARLNKPRGVTVDRAGNLYIADYNNSRIRKIAAPSGVYIAAR